MIIAWVGIPEGGKKLTCFTIQKLQVKLGQPLALTTPPQVNREGLVQVVPEHHLVESAHTEVGALCFLLATLMKPAA